MFRLESTHDETFEPDALDAYESVIQLEEPFRYKFVHPEDEMRNINVEMTGGDSINNTRIKWVGLPVYA